MSDRLWPLLLSSENVFLHSHLLPTWPIQAKPHRLLMPEVIKTDHHHLKAQVDFMATNHLITEFFKNIKRLPSSPVSSASTLAELQQSWDEEVLTTQHRFWLPPYVLMLLEIWTDVNGVLCRSAQGIWFLYNSPTYLDEASEISHFGAKVIYPYLLSFRQEKTTFHCWSRILSNHSIRVPSSITINRKTQASKGNLHFKSLHDYLGG